MVINMLLAGVNTIKKNFDKYLDNVTKNANTVTITRKNNENVVMISEKEYQELLADKQTKENTARFAFATA